MTCSHLHPSTSPPCQELTFLGPGMKRARRSFPGTGVLLVQRERCRSSLTCSRCTSKQISIEKWSLPHLACKLEIVAGKGFTASFVVLSFWCTNLTRIDSLSKPSHHRLFQLSLRLNQKSIFTSMFRVNGETSPTRRHPFPLVPRMHNAVL